MTPPRAAVSCTTSRAAPTEATGMTSRTSVELSAECTSLMIGIGSGLRAYARDSGDARSAVRPQFAKADISYETRNSVSVGGWPGVIPRAAAAARIIRLRRSARSPA